MSLLLLNMTSGTPSVIADMGGTNFDGASYLTRGADLTGNSDSKLLLFDIIFKRANSGGGEWLSRSTDEGLSIVFDSSSRLSLTGKNSSNSDVFTLTFNTPFNDTDYHQLTGSVNVGTSVLQAFTDGVEDKRGSGSSVSLDENIDFTKAGHGFMAKEDGTGIFEGDIGRMYLAYGQFLDLSVTSNLRLFRTAGGRPTEIGSDGSTPTGTAPLVLQTRATGDTAASMGTNKGTGGGMTTTGTLTNASANP